MRWIALLSLLTHFILLGAIPQQNEILSDVQVQYQFEDQLSVQAMIANTQVPQQAFLLIQPDGQETQQFDLTVNKNQIISAKIDLHKTNFPAFSRVYYWFKLILPNASTYTSPSYWFDYIDNRFSWQTNESKWFTIHWINGNPAFGESLQSIAFTGLKNATKIVPISPTLPISIYVYPDSQSLQAVLTKSGSVWIAGEARPELGVVLVSSSTDLNSTTELERQIPHELTHLLEYGLTQTNYSLAPAWLLEGLATNAETYLNSDHARTLQNAYRANTLIPINQLCGSFPSESSQVLLAYAESASFVTFLTNQYGTERISTLLSNSGTGLSCEQLVSNSLGKNLTDLEAEWKIKVFDEAAGNNSILTYWPALIIVLLILIPLFILRHRIFHSNKKENLYDSTK